MRIGEPPRLLVVIAGQPSPRADERVIAIDTGAGALPDGALSAVVLPEVRFVTVRPEP